MAQTIADATAGAGEGVVFTAANRSPRFIPRHRPRRDTDGQASGPSAIKAPRRTPATKALGEAVFKGTAGLSIPQNLELQSASGQRYRTSQSGVLSAQGTATITLKSVQGGVKGNASAGAPLTLASTVVGVSPTAKVAPGGLVGGALPKS